MKNFKNNKDSFGKKNRLSFKALYFYTSIKKIYIYIKEVIILKLIMLVKYFSLISAMINLVHIECSKSPISINPSSLYNVNCKIKHLLNNFRNKIK